MSEVPIYIKTKETANNLKGSGVLLKIDHHIVVATCKHVFGENRSDTYYTHIHGNEVVIGPGTSGYHDDPGQPEYTHVPIDQQRGWRALHIDDVAYQVLHGCSDDHVSHLLNSAEINSSHKIELRAYNPQSMMREVVAMLVGDSYDSPGVDYPAENNVLPIVMNMVKLADADVRMGHSGSPVFQVGSNKVIGLLSRRIAQGQESNMCIVRSEYLRARFLELIGKLA